MDTSNVWEYVWTLLLCGTMYDTSNVSEYAWTLLISCTLVQMTLYQTIVHLHFHAVDLQCNAEFSVFSCIYSSVLYKWLYCCLQLYPQL